MPSRSDAVDQGTVGCCCWHKHNGSMRVKKEGVKLIQYPCYKTPNKSYSSDAHTVAMLTTHTVVMLTAPRTVDEDVDVVVWHCGKGGGGTFAPGTWHLEPARHRGSE